MSVTLPQNLTDEITATLGALADAQAGDVNASQSKAAEAAAQAQADADAATALRLHQDANAKSQQTLSDIQAFFVSQGAAGATSTPPTT